MSSSAPTRRLSLAELLREEGLFVDGDWVESKDQDPEGDVRLIQLADVGDGVYLGKSARFLTMRRARELKCTFLEPGDILVARMPDPLGRACVFPGDHRPCVTVVDVCVVRPGANVDRQWLLYAINSPAFRRQIEQHIKGTTRQRISRTNLGTIELDVPPLPEQRRVAGILDKAAAIRRKREEAVALIEKLLPSAFAETFGDPVTNPKGWQVKPLSELAELIDYGVTASANTRPVGPKFLRITDIQDNRVDWSGVPYCECDGSEVARSSLKSGDIVFARTGATTGKSFWVRECPEGTVFASYLIRVRPGPRIVPAYLAQFFQSAGYWSQIRSMAEGAAQPGVNASKLAALRVPVSPLARQKRFEELSAKVSKMRGAAEEALRSAAALFDSLTDTAFRARAPRDRSVHP